MENLLESNERTLVIFDAVCSGLAECLELVHADIKQMTEHRNHLLTQQQVELERQQQQQQAGYTETDLNHHHHQPTNQLTANSSPRTPSDTDQDKTLVQTTDLDSTLTTPNAGSLLQPDQLAEDQDPHHLARLKLLDKRLADSFSQALSMCSDQARSSQARAREQRAVACANATKTADRDRGTRPSILQMILGRGSKQLRNHKKEETEIARAGEQQPLDTRLIIDDINRQTRLAMQYSKQLEANLFKVEDLRAKYEMHLKMGLVVKSVSRAYLTNPYTGDEQHMPTGSLGRPQHQRRAQHLSSLMVNDSSSLGATTSTTTTRSSLSSLNLSTWSFSRRQHSDRSGGGGGATKQQQQSQRKHSHQGQPPGVGAHESMLEDQRQQQQRWRHDQQKYVSTISLDSMGKQQARRLGLSKLISPTSGGCGGDGGGQHNNKQHSAHSPTSSQNTQLDVPTTYQLDHKQHLLYQEQDEQFTCAGGGECNCRLVDLPGSPPLPPMANAHNTSQSSFQTPTGPPTRPLSQYIYGATSEFATPTTMGTLAGSLGTPREFSSYAANQTGGAGAGGLLHKSASHSSLKKLKGNSSSHRMSGLYPNAPQMGGSSTGSGSSKTTIKEFIDNIERIEAEFESYMGSFLMNIEDIQGFARVCQGDVFEISIRYGTSQKFKTKISVLKDSRQKCDHKQTVFKARIADVIAIKAYECKGLGKKVLLGHKLCETRDLFMARSQLMTISLNQTGSIKLNLVITWNPLHMTPNSSLALQPGLDISHISLPPTPISSSTLSSVSSAQSSAHSAAGGKCANNNNNNNINNKTIISIKSNSNSGGGGDKPTRRERDHKQCGPNFVTANCEVAPTPEKHENDAIVHQYHYQHPVSEHQLKRARQQPAQIYQDDVEPTAAATYGYYIPEPDYLSSDLKY